MNNLFGEMMSNPFEGILGGAFSKAIGKVENGMCRLSLDGNIAVRTSDGYKSYNIKTGKLTKSGNFVLDPGIDCFYVLPASTVKKGDIIVSSKGGKYIPRCVLEVLDDDNIKVINYEDATIETIVPERHVLMKNVYFYGVVRSPFENTVKSKSGMTDIMKMAMRMSFMTSMFNGGGSCNNQSNNMLPLMMMSGMMGGDNSFGNFFDGLFNFDFGFTFGEDSADASHEDEEND